MRGFWLVMAACVLLLANGMGGSASGVQASGHSADIAAKKVCKTVTKKVHGKKRKVKVCHSVKPAPTPTPLPTATATAVPSDVRAQQLATAVLRASTVDDRYAAIVAVMQALHIPVMAGDGSIVSNGYAASLNDLVLYDFELRAIASGMQRSQTVSVAGLSSTLALSGVLAGSQPLNADTIAQALEQMVQTAVAQPTNTDSLLPLLIRDLGQGHSQPYDLSTAVPATQIELDPLQTELLLVDTAHAVSDAQKAAARPVVLGGFHRAQVDPCSDTADKFINGTGARKAAKTGFYEALQTVSKGAVTVLKKAFIALDAVHAVATAFSIEVTPLEEKLLTTHYGPAGHANNAGKVLRFPVLVRMQDKYPDALVKCGRLAGYKIPAYGPIPGVEIIWEQAVSDLQKYGTIAYDPSDGKTGKDGIANLVFTPNTEKFPKFGLEKDARGSLDAIGLYAGNIDPTKLPITFDPTADPRKGGILKGIDPAFFGQFLTPKYAGFAWQVIFHKPRGFKVKIPITHVTISNEEHWTDSTYTLHVCGDDPYVTPWQGTVHHDVVDTVVPDNGTTYDLPLKVSLVDGAPANVDFSPTVSISATFQLTTGANPQMHVVGTYTNGFGESKVADATVPVQEDFSCPDNSQG